MKLTKSQQDERTEAIVKLRTLLSPGQTVWTVIRHVSRSGMQRSISVVIPTMQPPTREGASWFELESLDYWISNALSLKIDATNGGVKIGGCGMDMGFHLVYSLGRQLWPKESPKPHGKRNEQPDHCGGYALKQKWL